MRIPSKTYILGEYGVLVGGPALVLCHGPYFETTSGTSSFHPKSPAGLAAQKLGRSPPGFVDPHGGRGGFGGSGAEFLSVLGKNSFSEQESWQAWELYRSLQAQGSGIDVLAQAYGTGKDPVLLHIDQKSKTIQAVKSHLGLTLWLHATGQKIPTHAHLESLNLESLTELALVAQEGILALEQNDKKRFLRSLNSFRETQEKLGLVAESTKDAAQNAQRNGVEAVKGCGALGADVLLSTGKIDSLVEVARFEL